MSMDIQSVTFIFINCISLAAGLSCWMCDNAPSEEECIQNGRIQRCATYQKMSCQTEVRFHEGWGGGPRIRTGCKEYHACHDNQVQNPKGGSNPKQCNPKRTNSVCRCCCEKRICNRRNMLCGQKNLQHTFNIIQGPPNPMRNDLEITAVGSIRDESRAKTTEIAPLEITVYVKYPVPTHDTPPVCSNLKGLEHGKVICNHRRKKLGTTCKFQCTNRGYVLNQNIRVKCVRINGKAVWSRKKPQCIPMITRTPPSEASTEKCPPAAKKDIVLMMDSSSSVGSAEWQAMKTFVFSLIREFHVSNESVQFAAVRFNTVVDFKTQILFGDFANDEEALILAIEQMPKTGSGRRLGSALKGVKDHVLTVRNRKEAFDVVLVFVGGKTKDMRRLRKVSKELREDGVEIVAVGLPKPEENGIARQMLTMTGKRNRVMMVKSTGYGLPKTLIDKISRFIC